MQAVPMLLAVGGSILKGVAANKAARHNSRVLEGQAREEERAGSEQELRIRAAARKAIGEQIAAQSSNGFLGGSGSALDALTESQVNAALDALQVRRDAQAKAMALRSEAGMQRSQGRYALAGALLGAGSDVAAMKSDWAAVKRPGGG